MVRDVALPPLPHVYLLYGVCREASRRPRLLVHLTSNFCGDLFSCILFVLSYSFTELFVSRMCAKRHRQSCIMRRDGGCVCVKPKLQSVCGALRRDALENHQNLFNSPHHTSGEELLWFCFEVLSS